MSSSQRAHWSNLVNMIELSICGVIAALCQITLTTCYYIYHLSPSQSKTDEL